jgi:hypothetical protein
VDAPTAGLVRPVLGPVVGHVGGSAEAEGPAERLARVADGLVLAVLVAVPAVACARDGVAEGRAGEAVVVGRAVCSAGDVAGLNVATDSIAPATRHTARMLASSGMTVPRAADGPNGASGPASRFSRFLRRCARSSRW